MELALLLIAVLVAGLACPAMMWWQRRQGREAACCVPYSAQPERSEAQALRARQDRLAARIAALSESGGGR